MVRNGLGFLYSKGPDRRASATKLWFSAFMALAFGFGFGAAARMLRLPDALFVQAVPYVAAFLAALTAFAGTVYHWGKGGQDEKIIEQKADP